MKVARKYSGRITIGPILGSEYLYLPGMDLLSVAANHWMSNQDLDALCRNLSRVLEMTSDASNVKA